MPNMLNFTGQRSHMAKLHINVERGGVSGCKHISCGKVANIYKFIMDQIIDPNYPREIIRNACKVTNPCIEMNQSNM